MNLKTSLFTKILQKTDSIHTQANEKEEEHKWNGNEIMAMVSPTSLEMDIVAFKFIESFQYKIIALYIAIVSKV